MSEEEDETRERFQTVRLYLGYKRNNWIARLEDGSEAEGETAGEAVDRAIEAQIDRFVEETLAGMPDDEASQ